MKVEIIIEEVVVEGEITHRSSCDIDVEIINPFENLSTGSHISCFARKYRSFDGEYGDETAKFLLKGLYDIGSYIDTNLVEIREILNDAKNSISDLPNKFEKEEFDIQRKELKRLLKQKEMSNIAYQRKLIALRKKHETYSEEVSMIMDKFFSDSFPMIVSYSMREEVLAIIEGKKNLTTTLSSNNGVCEFSRELKMEVN